MKYLFFLFGFFFLLSSCEDRLLEREEYSINLPGSWLDDMAVDVHGSLWLATGEIDTDENGKVILASVRQMYSGRTKIWIVANEIKPYEPGKVFLLTYDGNVWKRVSEVPEDDIIVDIEFDYYNNQAWVGTANNGCLHIK